jgi:hypothetical protein
MRIFWRPLHPGEPVLAYFEFAAVDEEDGSQGA